MEWEPVTLSNDLVSQEEALHRPRISVMTQCHGAVALLLIAALSMLAALLGGVIFLSLVMNMREYKEALPNNPALALQFEW